MLATQSLSAVEAFTPQAQGATAEYSSADERLSCAIVVDVAGLDALAADWQRLWAVASRREIFATFAWVRACWNIEGGGRQLHTVVVRAGSKVVGILPLEIRQGDLRFISHTFSDYNDILVDHTNPASVIEFAFRSLFQSSANWKTCTLTNLSEKSILYTSLDRLSQAFVAKTVQRVCAVCPTLTLGEDRVESVAAILKKTKNRYYQNRMGKLGKLVFRHLETRAEVREHFPKFKDQYVCRRALAGDQDYARHDRLFAVLGSAIEHLDPRSDLRFSVLELDGVALAYHLGFEIGDRLVYFKPTFNVDYWEHSPGGVLLDNLLLYARDRRLRVLDMAVGDEEYKNRVANTFDSNFEIVLHRAHLGSRIARALLAAKRAAKESQTVVTAWRAIATRCKHLSTTIRRVGPARAVGLLANVVKNSLLTRRDALVYVLDRTEHAAGAAQEAFEIDRPSLAGLARLNQDHPELFGVDQLSQARKRFRNGDQCLLTRDRTGRVIHIAWAGTRQVLEQPEFRSPIDLGSSLILIFDRWTAREYQCIEFYRDIMHRLIQELQPSQTSVVACTSEKCVSFRQAIEQLGFKARYRARSTSLLGSIRREVVSEFSQ